MKFKKIQDIAKLIRYVCDKNFISAYEIHRNIKSYSYFGVLDNFKKWVNLGILESQIIIDRRNFVKQKFRINKKGIKMVYKITLILLEALMKRIEIMPLNVRRTWLKNLLSVFNN